MNAAKPKYAIGENLDNTESYGNVTIKDILISPTSGNFVYLVQSREEDDESTFFAEEIEFAPWEEQAGLESGHDDGEEPREDKE